MAQYGAPQGGAASAGSPSLSGFLGGTIGGGRITQQQTLNDKVDENEFMKAAFSFQPFLTGKFEMQNKVTDQQKKDYNILQHTLIEACAKKCLKRQNNFAKESDFCQAKCYDVALVHAKVGLSELNQFIFDNSLY